MSLDLPQFSQEIIRILGDQTLIKLDGRFYMESYLRPCFNDSSRLELRKLQAADLVELYDTTEWNPVGMRPVPSEEMLAYDKSEESIAPTVQEPREDGTYRKKPDAAYKKVMRSLRAYENTALVLGLPKAPSKSVWSKSTSTRSVPSDVPRIIYPGPRGLVKVFKPCAIQVNKSCLKVDNIEISQHCNEHEVLVRERKTRNPESSAKPSLNKIHPKEKTALNVPPELYRVFDLYNVRNVPETIQESQWPPPKKPVKRATSSKSSSLYPKSSVKLFFCHHCRKLKKSHSRFPSQKPAAPEPVPSLEYFYQNLVQSLNKLSRKLPMG